jgi:hypothetical protein
MKVEFVQLNKVQKKTTKKARTTSTKMAHQTRSAAGHEETTGPNVSSTLPPVMCHSNQQLMMCQSNQRLLVCINVEQPIGCHNELRLQMHQSENQLLMQLLLLLGDVHQMWYPKDCRQQQLPASLQEVAVQHGLQVHLLCHLQHSLHF